MGGKKKQVSWTRLIRGNPDHAWVAKVPTWPLTLVFLAQFVAIAGAVCEYIHYVYSNLSAVTSPLLTTVGRVLVLSAAAVAGVGTCECDAE